MNVQKFKDGNKVRMINCGEATFPQNQKTWVCDGDSFIDRAGSEAVFLKGYSGYFICKYLTTEDAIQINK